MVSNEPLNPLEGTYRVIALERMRRGYRQYLEKRMLSEVLGGIDVQFDVFENVGAYFCAEMCAYLMGKRLDTVTIDYPVNWWEAFKEHWFPNWALDRWPARRKIHTITINAFIPEAQIYPGKSQYIVMDYHSATI